MGDRPTLTVKAAGSVPKIELHFGHAQLHKFEVALWGPNHAGAQVVASLDRLTDHDVVTGDYSYFLGYSVQALDGLIVTCASTIISAVGGDGEQYSVRFAITQDDLPLEPPADSVVNRAGELDAGLVTETASWKLKVI